MNQSCLASTRSDSMFALESEKIKLHLIKRCDNENAVVSLLSLSFSHSLTRLFPDGVVLLYFLPVCLSILSLPLSLSLSLTCLPLMLYLNTLFIFCMFVSPLGKLFNLMDLTSLCVYLLYLWIAFNLSFSITYRLYFVRIFSFLV